MKIVLDMQSRQSAGSRNRGIGRYSLSLAKAMLEEGAGRHEFLIVANAALGNAELVRRDFDLPKSDSAFQVFTGLRDTSAVRPQNRWRRRASELIREGFLRGLGADFVHATSVFDGFADDTAMAIHTVDGAPLTAATLYDLIPYMYPDIYLRHPLVRSCYLERLGQLRQADLLLAISDFSARYAVERLGVRADCVVNISGAADPHFHPLAVADDELMELAHRYSLHEFIMYTGGIDHRKNIDGLIDAYSRLPPPLIDRYQLAIVCSVGADERMRILAQAASLGVRPGRVVVTGYVSEYDLVRLYNACELFVFPSWCEGFGLPALEAMQCGAAVIAAGTSSLPEVVGRGDALFDPRDPASIAKKMCEALQDDGFRRSLEEHGLRQAQKFTWRECARRALDAMEASQSHASRVACVNALPVDNRPTLAFVSPLPPDRSGIAMYSSDLLKFLSKYYRITAIRPGGDTNDDYLHATTLVRDVDWFRSNARKFGRVIYQFGNSLFHEHMFELLREIPGVVVLHDLWLSGVIASRQLPAQPGRWTEELYYSHGWNSLLAATCAEYDDLRVRYPCSRSTIDMATGVIVHSEGTLDRLADWYGSAACAKARAVPLLKPLSPARDGAGAARALGYPAEARLICTFGFVDATKYSLEVIDAFLESHASKLPGVRLVMVGSNADSEYGREILERVEKSAGKVAVTGFVEQSDYDLYLQAAEVAVQLRRGWGGETSSAALDCLAYGVPLVINAGAAFAEIPRAAAYVLPEEVECIALIRAIDEVMSGAEARDQRVDEGRKYLREKCDPATVARQYCSHIESFYRKEPRAVAARICTEVAELDVGVPALEADLLRTGQAINRTTATRSDVPTRYLDAELAAPFARQIVSLLAGGFPTRGHVDLLALSPQGLVNARSRMSAALGLDENLLPDLPLEARPGSVCLFNVETVVAAFARGEAVDQVIASLDPRVEVLAYAGPDAFETPSLEALSTLATVADRFVVDNEGLADTLSNWLGLVLDEDQHNDVEFVRPDVETHTPGLQEGAPAWLRALVHPTSVSSRTVERPQGQRVWRAGHPALGTQVGHSKNGALLSDGSPGFLVFGPYCAVPSGRYRLRIFGAIDHNRAKDAWYDVVAARGRLRIVSPQPFLDPCQGVLAERLLELSSDVDDLEVRIWVEGREELRFLALSLDCAS